MNRHIYADNAATTQLDSTAFEAMLPYLKEDFSNPSQPYSFSRESKKAISQAREIIAECIGADPEEIYFTSGGTESDNWVIKSSAFSDYDYRATITSAFEHHAVLRSCSAIEKMGYPVAYIYPDASGEIRPDELKSLLTNKTRLVSIMYANNEIGSIQPIQDLCKIAHESGALFHTDAVQAVGHVKIDVKNLGVDFLSASAHKFNGPKGIGFLYIKKGVNIIPYINGGAQENGYRSGTENVASIVAMATALKNNCEAMDKNTALVLSLEKQLLKALNEAEIAYVRNGGENTLPGLLSLSFRGFDGEAILHRMDLMGISISTGSACDSVKTEISHVLQAIRMDEELARGTIRISLGKNNTVEDVVDISNALIKIIK